MSVSLPFVFGVLIIVSVLAAHRFAKRGDKPAPWEMTFRRKWPSRIILGFMALYFFGGFLAFPLAPYRACASGYCDKRGMSHTLAEYRHLKMWEIGLVGIWATGGLALYLLNRRPTSSRLQP